MTGLSIIALVGLCVVLAVYLWFRRVHRMMAERQNAVEIAAKQRRELRICGEGQPPEEFAAVLERSESIYHQAAGLYTQALEHPLHWLPATILGYRPILEDKNDAVKM